MRNRWIIVLLMSVLLWMIPIDQEVEASTPLYINQHEVELEDSAVFIENDRLYVPIRFVAEQLDANVSWNQDTQEVRVRTKDKETFIFRIDDIEMQWNKQTYYLDVKPVVVDERTYVPARHIAEWLHMNVTWNQTDRSISFDSIKPVQLEQDMSWQELSLHMGVSEEDLKERNPDIKENPRMGDLIKIIIPQSFHLKPTAEATPVEDPDSQVTIEEEFPPEVVDLLARIIYTESGYEEFEGQIAVGNVVMNRIADGNFPNTLEEVIYQPGQFTPVQTGRIERVTPNESSIEAAKKVLAGEMLVEGALYFYNPQVSNYAFFNTLETIMDIGNHRFLK